MGRDTRKFSSSRLEATSSIWTDNLARLGQNVCTNSHYLRMLLAFNRDPFLKICCETLKIISFANPFVSSTQLEAHRSINMDSVTGRNSQAEVHLRVDSCALPITIMAKSKGRNKTRLALDEPENEETFRPTRAHRKSNAAKQATAEAKKERRRQYYARECAISSFLTTCLLTALQRGENPAKESHSHSPKTVNWRAIAKMKCSKSKPSRAETPQGPELTPAELAATETLAQMQAERAAQELGFHDPRGNSPTSRSREEIDIDEEISALWEEGERLCPSDSDDEEGTVDLGEGAKTGRNRDSLRARQRRRLLLVQTLGPKCSSRHTPSPDPPSPIPKQRLPSLYDKLFNTRQKD
ncbi:hypothetical protein R3P38DRAFT_2792095 [Favolaschia claudopus]|uniref:Uncharacterized protein n=1 Tax=Favolaschia claudopus TaxID=2862362 RepID=A0AAW0AFW3_9AGAR